jgi:hypothetical protein
VNETRQWISGGSPRPLIFATSVSGARGIRFHLQCLTVVIIIIIMVVIPIVMFRANLRGLHSHLRWLRISSNPQTILRPRVLGHLLSRLTEYIISPLSLFVQELRLFVLAPDLYSDRRLACPCAKLCDCDASHESHPSSLISERACGRGSKETFPEWTLLIHTLDSININRNTP